MDKLLSAAWEADHQHGGPLLVHRAVARWAVDTPDAPAISCADGALTYRELDERANRFAHELRSLGVAREAVVAIHLDRGLDHYVALLGVLKAGGVALPLDTTYPAARLRYMLEDSGALVLVTRQTLRTVAGGDGGDGTDGTRTIVRVDTDAERIAANPGTPLPDEVGPRDLAYVMYTSASTGNPKGVRLEHGGIANLCRWHVAALGLTRDDCGSLAAPLSFDASILDLWPLLVAGARTVGVDNGSRTDVANLVHALGENRVTVCFLTTALAEILLAQPGLEELSLRYLVTGGEALRRRPRRGMPFQLVNIYGPTETTVYVTSVVVSPDGTGVIPIGHAIGGVHVRLLDPRGRPVPDGEAGEIVVAGPGVARGYIGQPELTSRRFRPVPGGPPEARCYHTGDLARRGADGTFEFLGRLDRQVKVRGHRIEPEEVERVLLAQPAVRQAAVAVIRPTEETAQLVAYVEADAECSAVPSPDEGWCGEDAEYRARGDVGTLAAVRAVAPDSLLEVGAGVPGLDRTAGSHTRVLSIQDLTAPGRTFGAVLIDCFSARHTGLEQLTGDIVRAVEMTADGGTVLVGGVRALPLLRAAHLAAEIAAAPDSMTMAELRWRASARQSRDTGLAVHPAAFTALAARLARVTAIEVNPRFERLSMPSYDVLLRVGGEPAKPVTAQWLDWTGDQLDLTRIRDLLRAGETRTLGVRAIPNGLVPSPGPAWEQADTSATVGELRSRPRTHEAAVPTPVDLLALAVGVPYQVRLSWSAARADGSVDAMWSRESGPVRVHWPAPEAEPRVLASRPFSAARDEALREQLRAALADRFVAHEMPDLFVLLDRLPLTPVGKVDRGALPLPDWLTGARSAADAPRTAAEEAVAELVADVLGRTRIGRTDDLVALGAHSLTMTQLAARITGRLGVELGVRRLLAAPTVSAIARLVSAAVADELRDQQEVA